MESPSEEEKTPKGHGRPRNNKKKKKGAKNNPEALRIRRQLAMCCKHNDLATAMTIVQQAKEQRIPLEAFTYYNLLNLADGLTTNRERVHIGTPKPDDEDGNDNKKDAKEKPKSVDLKTRQDFALQIKQEMAEKDFPLTETCYSALIKLSCRSGNLDQAKEQLAEAENVQQCKPKLRLYSTLLCTYCKKDMLVEACEIWKKVLILKDESVALTEKEYLELLQSATRTGVPSLADMAISFVSEETPVPSQKFADAIRAWFESPHSLVDASTQQGTALVALLTEIAELQKQRDPYMDLPSLLTNFGRQVKKWEISDQCTIDSSQGLLTSGCLTGRTLAPSLLPDAARHQMIRMNASIVTQGHVEGNQAAEFQGGRKGRKRPRNSWTSQQRQACWNRFTALCTERYQQDPIEVVIDGANVGYFQTNFDGAPKHVDYNQIDWVVRHFLEVEKKRVLIVMHERHFVPSWVPPEYRPIVQSWKQRGILYQTPTGLNDDWFWMHVALECNSLVLTNDEMRDHHFQMLAPRMFLRWKDRCQVHFEFGTWESGGDVQRRQVLLQYPEAYSRRIQRVGTDGLVVPLAKRGDDQRFLDGCHVANDPDIPKEETYLCFRAHE